MYDYDKKHHFLTISTASETGTSDKTLLAAPAIIIAPGDLTFNERYSNDDGYSDLQVAQNLAACISARIICGTPSDVPTEYILANCLFRSEVTHVAGKDDEYYKEWKTFHVKTTPKGSFFRMVHVPSLKAGRRIIVCLECEHAAISYTCRIQHNHSESYECELYKVRYMPYETPPRHAPIEIGIRDYTNYPATAVLRNIQFNISNVLQDYCPPC